MSTLLWRWSYTYDPVYPKTLNPFIYTDGADISSVRSAYTSAHLVGGSGVITTNAVAVSAYVDQVVDDLIANIHNNATAPVFLYNNNGQISHIQATNITGGGTNPTWDFTYDNNNRLIGVAIVNAGPVTSLGFAYSGTGRVLQYSINGVDQTYGGVGVGDAYLDLDLAFAPSYKILGITGSIEGYTNISLCNTSPVRYDNGAIVVNDYLSRGWLPNWTGSAAKTGYFNRLYSSDLGLGCNFSCKSTAKPITYDPNGATAGTTLAYGFMVQIDKGDGNLHYCGFSQYPGTGYFHTSGIQYTNSSNTFPNGLSPNLGGTLSNPLILAFGDYANLSIPSSYAGSNQVFLGIRVTEVGFTGNFNLIQEYTAPPGNIFPISEGVGIVTTLTFSNTVTVNSSGVEQRLVKWQDPIRSFNFSRKLLTQAESTAILNFFQYKLGSETSFLYTDRSDYQDDGDGILWPSPDGSRTHFQLCKRYYVFDVGGASIHYRAITAPKQIYTIAGFNGTWTANGATGEIVLSSAPASGNLISVTFDFYVPVVFETDDLTRTIVSPDVYKIDKLILKEIRQIPYIYPVDSLVDSPDGIYKVQFPATLDFLANNQLSTNYDTEVVTLSSGYTKRTPRIVVPWTKLVLAQRKTFTAHQFKILRSFWLANKGNGAYFYYNYTPTGQIVPARFATQEFTYSLLSTNMVYEIAPLELKIFLDGDPLLSVPMAAPADVLSKPLLTLARVCNITNVLPSGTKQYGFTTADRDIYINGLQYKANTAFDPTAVIKNIDIAVDNQEIKSILMSDEITELELATGLFDNATVTVAVVDYLNPPATIDDAVVEQVGLVGEVMNTDTYYQMENLTRADTLLRQNVNIKGQFLCRYNFCDFPTHPSSHCTLDITNFQWTGTIADANNFNNLRQLYINPVSGSIPDSGLAYGSIIFTSGANKDLQYVIFNNYLDSNRGFNNTGYLIVFFNSTLLVPAAVGDTCILVGGCNKRFETCVNKYHNGINFGGEPAGGHFMPTNDFYLQGGVLPGA